jgi:hypothetical protein
VGTLSDVYVHLRQLVRASRVDAFLVITVEGTEQVLQFAFDEKGRVLMEWPLVNPEQSEWEERIAGFCREKGLSLDVETYGGEGRFLDVRELPKDARRLTSIAQAALEACYGVGTRTTLRFDGEGLGEEE